MKKKILLPTDFSKNSWTAIIYASKLYKNEKVDFYLLNAFQANTYTIDTLMVPEPGQPLYEEAKEESYAGLEELLEQVEDLSTNENHAYYTVSSYNTPLEAVKYFIEDKDIKMVVVSNKGATNTSETYLGSNTIDMMENVRNCPVLMIPVGISFKEPNEIVFPTSFKTHYKQKELHYLYEIAKITNAPIRILHIAKDEELTEDQKEKKALLEECLEGLKYSFHYLKDTDINKGVRIFVQSRGSEMITFINKKHHFLETIFTKPMVKELGYKATVPVLTLHDLRN